MELDDLVVELKERFEKTQREVSNYKAVDTAILTIYSDFFGIEPAEFVCMDSV